MRAMLKITKALDQQRGAPTTPEVEAESEPEVELSQNQRHDDLLDIQLQREVLTITRFLTLKTKTKTLRD